ncbi:MAG: VTT domain-containing protein [Candidatus Aenigmarchaeota archaeon]|nr:VTT domain-containing protein [Candidatus Aenigmarchaeota archaeon]
MAVAEFLVGLVHTFGYLGVFIAAAIANATVLLPVPAFIFIITAGAVLNPWLVALAGALGAALGELTGYGVGYGGRRVLKHKNAHIRRAQQWFMKRPSFAAIALFSALPLPFDVIGIFCGVIKYDIRKFVVAVFIGRFVLYAALAYASSMGIMFLPDFFR